MEELMIGKMETNYFETIVGIRDKKDTTTIPLSNCSIQKITSTFSNTKIPIYKLVINNKPISRNNTYVVDYKCQTCNSQKEITLNLFMRKVNKETTRCETCKNQDETKCNNQRQFMKENMSKILSGEYIKQTIKVKSNSLEQHLEKSNTDWSLEDVDFKEQYIFSHLSVDDYNRILPKIVSIGNDKITSLQDWTYFPTYRIYNQSRYTPMLIHKTENKTEKPLYIKFKCENCDCEFVHRDLEVVKNNLRIFCQTCTLTNRTFQLRKKKLASGETILWQSVPERRFIEWCEENNIQIKNGPKLPYIFNDKQHMYRVDFELPKHKLLVEIKDNHCWHQEQLKSGKFSAKENSANEWCNENKYRYHVLFPKTIQKFKNSILENSL
jgi:hypothetical protein